MRVGATSQTGLRLQMWGDGLVVELVYEECCGLQLESCMANCSLCNTFPDAMNMLTANSVRTNREENIEIGAKEGEIS